jgi:two-component system NarL family sensor kinase
MPKSDDPQILSLFIITTVIIFLFLTLIFGIIFLFKKSQSKMKRDIEFLNLNHEKTILSTELEIQEQTFKHISQEIHDNISLTLTLAKLNLNVLDISDKGEIKSTIENTVDLISKAIADLTDISKSLDSEMIKSHGLIHAIEAEKLILNKSGLFDVGFSITGEYSFIDGEKELILFRIVQESCNNIIKHSKAKRISIMLHYHQAELQLSIEDDGIGFDVEVLSKLHSKKIGSGLNNIKNRAKMIEAKAEITSVIGSGTRVNIQLPLQKQTENNGTEN